MPPLARYTALLDRGNRTITREAIGTFAYTRDIDSEGQYTLYPSLEEISSLASEGRLDDNDKTFEDLFLVDLIWAQAIASDRRLQDPMSSKIMKPLVELLRRGIYD